MCDCDPSRSILTHIFQNFIKHFPSGKQLNLVNDSRACYWCVSESEQRISNPSNTKIYTILDKCIELYKVVNITQRSSAGLCLTLSLEYLKLIEGMWQDELKTIGSSKNLFTSILQESLAELAESYKSSTSPIIVSVETNHLRNLQILLGQSYLTNQCVLWTFRHTPNSKSLNQCKTVSIGITPLPNSFPSLSSLSLLLYRKFLIASYINKVSRNLGYINNSDSELFFKLPEQNNLYSESIFIVREDAADQMNSTPSMDMLVLRIGNVLTKGTIRDVKHDKCETIESFFRRRLQNMEKDSVETPTHSQELSPDKISLSNSALVQATINYDLLSPSPASQLELESFVNARNVNEHDSFIIIYNYSRLISILRKFKQKVACKLYTESVPIEEVDFSKLKHEKEISLIQMLLEWPRILENTVDFHRQEINIDAHLKFVKELAYRFNAFYTLIAVLAQPSSSHEFDLMFTRIYFLTAIRNIFQEFFELILIEFESDDDPLNQKQAQPSQ